MSFPRHEGIFRSDGRGSCRSGARSERLHAPTHRLDEFPTGYSLAGWSPPEPASASPAEQKFTMKAAPQPSLFQRMGKPCLAGCLTTGVHPIYAAPDSDCGHSVLARSLRRLKPSAGKGKRPMAIRTPRELEDKSGVRVAMERKPGVFGDHAVSVRDSSSGVDASHALPGRARR